MSLSVTEIAVSELSEVELLDAEELTRRSKHIVRIPKRGKSPESRSDVYGGLVRAAVDHVVGAGGRESMAKAFRAGCTLFESSCYICGYPVYRSTGDPFEGLLSPQADHILPHSLGGVGAAGHLLPTHRVCNDAKSNALVEDYLFDRPEALRRINRFKELYEVTEMPGLYAAVTERVAKAFAGLSADLTELGLDYDLEVPPFYTAKPKTEDVAEEKPKLPAAVLAKMEANAQATERKKLLAIRNQAEEQVRRWLRTSGLPEAKSIYTSANGVAA